MFIEFPNYGNGKNTLVNTTKILYIQEIDYNGRPGTEFLFDNKKSFITSMNLYSVKKILEGVKNG